MGARPCERCGRLRKDGTISTPDGLTSPPCHACGAPATIERPAGRLDPLPQERPAVRVTAEVDRQLLAEEGSLRGRLNELELELMDVVEQTSASYVDGSVTACVLELPVLVDAKVQLALEWRLRQADRG